MSSFTVENIPTELCNKLLVIYEEMMWLAHRPGVTESQARAWYTHVMATTLRRRLRHFTGEVSKEAAKNTVVPLRLEHFNRIQTKLTGLVRQHKKLAKPNPDEFIQLLVECERVRIVTFHENYKALRAKGNYIEAGIELLSWDKLRKDRQAELWKKVLQGKVANANDYRPKLK